MPVGFEYQSAYHLDVHSSCITGETSSTTEWGILWLYTNIYLHTHQSFGDLVLKSRIRWI